MTRVWFSYALTRVKMKLSFHSLVQGKTLFEIWGHQIITSFRFLRDSGQIECELNGDQERQIFHFLFHTINDFCLKHLIQNRLKKELTVLKKEKKQRADQEVLQQIKVIRDRDRCFDLFYYTKVKEMKMYPNY